MAKYLEPDDVFDVDVLPVLGTNVITNGDLPSAFVFALADANQPLLLYGGASNVTIGCDDFPRSAMNLLMIAPSFANRAQAGIVCDGSAEGIVYINGTDYPIHVNGSSAFGEMGNSTNQFIWGPGPGEPGKMLQLAAPSNLGEFKVHEFSIYKSTDDVSVFGICFRWWRSSTIIA